MNDHASRNPWTTLSSRTEYENPWISVSHRQVVNPGGGEGIYGVVHFKNCAVGILPLDDELNTWLVGQYRYPIDAYSWEIPAGGGALNSDPLLDAQRELLEETGMRATRWKKILESHLSNSVSDECATIFVARALTFGQSSPEESEDLQLRKMPFSEALRMVQEGEITDAMTMLAILKVDGMLTRGELIR